jgi:hypothetical protein
MRGLGRLKGSHAAGMVPAEFVGAPLVLLRLKEHRAH